MSRRSLQLFERPSEVFCGAVTRARVLPLHLRGAYHLATGGHEGTAESDHAAVMAGGVKQYEQPSGDVRFSRRRPQADPRLPTPEPAGQLGIVPRPVRCVLEIIPDWCLRDKKPPLTILSSANTASGRGKASLRGTSTI